MATSKKWLTLDVSIELVDTDERRVLYTDANKNLRYEARRLDIRATVHDNGVVGMSMATLRGPIIKANGEQGMMDRSEMFFAIEDIPAYLQPTIQRHAPEVWYGHMTERVS